MTTSEIQDKVLDIICKQVNVAKDKITAQTKIAEDLGADSLAIAEMVMEMEDEFEINIPDDAEGKIKTVGDAVAYIEEQLKKKA